MSLKHQIRPIDILFFCPNLEFNFIYNIILYFYFQPYIVIIIIIIGFYFT